jgi:hypothetical protein
MKNTHNNSFFAAILLATISFFWSCQKTDFNNIQPADHESEWALPLFKTSVGIEDLLQKTLVDTAAKLLISPNGALTFYYQGNLAEKYASELFNLFKNQTIPILGQNFAFPLDVPSQLHIKKAVLKSGFIYGGGINLISDTILVRVKILQMTKNGQPFVHEYKLAPTGFVFNPFPINLLDSTSVEGFTVESSDDSLHFSYESFYLDGSPASLLAAGLKLGDLKFKYVEGFWEKSSFPLNQDTIPIDIYKFVKGDGKIKFENPRVTAYILNSFGFPTKAQINDLKVILKDGTTIGFTGSALTDGISAVYPSLQEVGQTKVTEFYFDKNNSNIDQVFNSQPQSLVYDFNGISNPDNDPNFVGFITDESKVQLRVRVELPLRAFAKDFVVEDTIDVDFGSYNSVSANKIRSAEFKIITENAMPVGLKTQITFLNTQNQPIDSLFSAGEADFLTAAPVDADGEVTGKSKNEFKIPMDSPRFDGIRSAKKVILRTRFNTSGGQTQHVTAKQNQRTDIRMGLKVVLFD